MGPGAQVAFLCAEQPKNSKLKLSELGLEGFSLVLAKLGMTDRETAVALFKLFDKDNSGAVDFDEWVIALNVMSSKDSAVKMRALFEFCDLNGDGKVTRKELGDSLSSLFHVVSKLTNGRFLRGGNAAAHGHHRERGRVGGSRARADRYLPGERSGDITRLPPRCPSRAGPAAVHAHLLALRGHSPGRQYAFVSSPQDPYRDIKAGKDDLTFDQFAKWIQVRPAKRASAPPRSQRSLRNGHARAPELPAPMPII